MISVLISSLQVYISSSDIAIITFTAAIYFVNIISYLRTIPLSPFPI